MSKALFAQRRDGRVAALQYLYAWSINPPANLAEDLRVFFENLEHPRDHYAFGEELIHGVIDHIADIDARIKGLAHNWEFDRIAKIDLGILRLAMFEMIISVREKADWRRVREYYFEHDGAERSYREHRLVIDALMDRDPARAETMMRDHLDKVAQTVLGVDTLPLGLRG